MKKNNKKTQKNKSITFDKSMAKIYVFPIIYGILVLLAIFIKNITPIVIALFCITSLIDGLLNYSDKTRRVFICVLCSFNILLFILTFFILSNFFIILIYTHNSICSIYYVCYFFRYKTINPTSKRANLNPVTVLTMAIPFLYVISALVTYLNQGPLIIYTTYLTGVLTVIFAILSLTIYKRTFSVLVKKGFQRVLVVILSIICIFVYSFFTVTTINGNFPYNTYTNTYEIIDKKVSGGPKSIKRYEFYIIYNNEKIGVKVSKDLYIKKVIGETVSINYNEGFLSIPFLTSAE